MITSGGSGTRMKIDIPKQFLKIGGKSLLELSISKFQDHTEIDDIFIVSHKDLINRTEELLKVNNFSKVKKIIPGGETRQLSVRAGVNASTKEHKNILIHDSARPFISPGLISRILNALDNHDAVTPVIDSSDTIILTAGDGRLTRYLDRETIKRVQTPQGFKRDIIIKAHALAATQPDLKFTDDCSIITHFGLSGVTLVDGDPKNIKITHREDLALLNPKV